MNEAESLNIVDCLGADGVNHLKISWKEEALCGMKIHSHGFNPNLYSCWECGAINEGEAE